MKHKLKRQTWNSFRLPPRKSDPEAWQERARKIASLVESGKTLLEIGTQLRLTKERARQLMNELGIKTANWHRAQRRHRNPTSQDLRKIRALCRSGLGKEKIAKELDMDYLLLAATMIKHKIFYKYRCLRCEREFSEKAGLRKYCRACGPLHQRERSIERFKDRYKTDPEFRKRILRNRKVWRQTEVGRRYVKECVRKKRESHAKHSATVFRKPT